MIWHLLPLSQWQSSRQAVYLPEPGGAPFLHASPDEKVTLAVANDRFARCEEPLVALGLDERQLSSPVRYEAPDPAPPPGVSSGTLFPHIYGPAETASVTEVRYARRDLAGHYSALEVRPPTAEALDLLPHALGGWYRQTWAAGPEFEPAGYPGRRAPATAIYYLLLPGRTSHWHQMRGDEMWLWHSGGPLTLLQGGTGTAPADAPEEIVLGPDPAQGHRPQHVVPGGNWQCVRTGTPEEALTTIVVSPGFDTADFGVPPGSPPLARAPFSDLPPGDPAGWQLDVAPDRIQLYLELTDHPRPLELREAAMLVDLIDAWRELEHRKHTALMSARHRAPE